ncbi:MAG: DUF3709 domain-containing protein [Chloroflexi bacterium]|nr:DUF3709 domain-containing protein [Chloroflexota bacterium]
MEVIRCKFQCYVCGVGLSRPSVVVL